MTMPGGLLSSGSGSAIADLLQTLQAQGPQQIANAPVTPPPMSPVPNAPPMPTIEPPPQTESGGLLHRIVSNLSNIGAPNAPAGYSGLLSDKEIDSAKPGFGARLSALGADGVAPSQQYRDNLNNIVKMKQIAAQTAESQRVMAARRQMATMFPLPENPTIDDIRTNLAKQYSWAMSHGDEETMKDVGSRLTSIFAAPKPEVNKVLGPGSALVGPNGEVLAKTDQVPHAPLPGTPEWKAAEDFKASLAAKYRVEPQQIIQGADENGNPSFFRVPKEGGAPVKIDGMTPKVVVKSESAQQELTRARAEAAVSEMNNGTKYMADFERRLSTGEAKIGNAGQILGSMANTFTHDDPASKAIQNSALTALNKSNPDLARYIRRALSFAEAESMISSRPSDFRTRMSAFLSQAANGATPDMISDIQARRNAIMNPLNRIYSQAASDGGAKSSPRAVSPAPAAPSGPSKRAITRDQANFLQVKKGMSPAQIAAMYTVQP